MIVEVSKQNESLWRKMYANRQLGSHHELARMLPTQSIKEKASNEICRQEKQSEASSNLAYHLVRNRHAR